MNHHAIIAAIHILGVLGVGVIFAIFLAAASSQPNRSGQPLPRNHSRFCRCPSCAYGRNSRRMP